MHDTGRKNSYTNLRIYGYVLSILCDLYFWESAANKKNLTPKEKIKDKSVTGTVEQIIDTACKR